MELFLNPPGVISKKLVLENLAKLTGKHLCQNLFVNNVVGLSLQCFHDHSAKFEGTLFCSTPVCMLCYVMFWCVMLCYFMLRYVMLGYVVLCYVLLCHVMLCYGMLRYVMLCYVMVWYVTLRYVMFCYVM